MEYDVNKDGEIETSELLKAINDWLSDKIDAQELLKVINKWVNPEFEVPEGWQQEVVSASDLTRKCGLRRLNKMDDKYYTVRPEILLNDLIGVEFSPEWDRMTVALVAMGHWHLKKELAKTACFLAWYTGQGYKACFVGEKLFLTDGRERAF